jgi:hypothetical protein
MSNADIECKPVVDPAQCIQVTLRSENDKCAHVRMYKCNEPDDICNLPRFDSIHDPNRAWFQHGFVEPRRGDGSVAGDAK